MKYAFIATLVIIIALIIFPPLYYDYWYPTSGDDTATHLLYFQNFNDGDVPIYHDVLTAVPEYPLYYGQYLVGKLINSLPFDHNISFAWFNYIILILSVIIVGIVVSVSTNYKAGIIAVILLFGRSFLLTLFGWGAIFDVIGIAIILPLLLLCLHNIDGRWWWKIGIVVLLPVFALFHTNGKYLIALIPIIIIYEVARIIISKKKLELAQKMKEYRILSYCLLMVGALVVAYIFRVSIDPARQWIDASILVCMGIAIIVGKMKFKTLYFIGIVILACAISVPVTKNWLNDNSVLKIADKQAITYVNSLDGISYSVSPEITKAIYYLYVDKSKQMVNYGGDYIITRSIAMTETSAIAVIESDSFTTDGYWLLKKFNDGQIETKVYEKLD